MNQSSDDASARPYVLTWGDEFVTLFGPFGSEEAAVAFGGRWQQHRGDDPCWNTVQFTGDPEVGIVRPEDANFIAHKETVF